jgi:hypothetical protein
MIIEILMIKIHKIFKIIIFRNIKILKFSSITKDSIYQRIS